LAADPNNETPSAIYKNQCSPGSEFGGLTSPVVDEDSHHSIPENDFFYKGGPNEGPSATTDMKNALSEIDHLRTSTQDFNKPTSQSKPDEK
jgi:hypothetical protein